MHLMIFFANIGPILRSKFGTTSTRHSALDSVKSSLKSLFFQPITPAELFHKINLINSKKANDPENIAVKYFKLPGS